MGASGFRDQRISEGCPGFRVRTGFRVQGSEFRVQGLGFGVSAALVQCLPSPTRYTNLSTVTNWQLAASTVLPMASGRSIGVQLHRGRSPSCAPTVRAPDGALLAALLLAPFPRGEKREVPESEGASPPRSAGGVWGYDGEEGGGITPWKPLEAADPGEDAPREGEDCCVRARIWFSRLSPDRDDTDAGAPAPGAAGDRSSRAAAAIRFAGVITHRS